MDLKKEKELWKKGYKIVVGLDEAGRGALCGPVVAAAVSLNSKLKTQISKPQLKTQNLKILLKEINDSKKLTPKKREELYEILINHPLIVWGIGRVGPKVIDRINILEATKLAMERAIEKLKIKSPKSKVDSLILDGKMKLDLKIAQESIIEADGKIFSCAAASVIAKVARDRSMKNYYHKKYPQYDFAKNKGYGTRHHIAMIEKYGPCKIHRRSFKPIRTDSKIKNQNAK